MKLSKKTFLYSILLAVFMVFMITGYFAFMLPSLYVDYMKKDNLNSIVAIQQGYMETRSYEGLSVKNPSGTFTVEIPYTGDTIYAAGKFFKLTIKIKDEELKKILNTFRQAGTDMEGWSQIDADFEKISLQQLKEILQEKLFGEGMLPDDYPLEIQVDNQGASKVFQEEYDEEFGEMHVISQQLIVYESGISDGNNAYTTYMAMGKTEDSLVISFLPIMSPKMKEILPVVLGSLPMIVTVVFLIVLIFSGIFSRNIVNPVIRLAGYAEAVRAAEDFVVEPFKVGSHDEIGELGRTLNELYVSLQEKNRSLEEENERQEVFLRASSHQLKTPITAALLLVEGMMNQVGKYKNTAAYLPKVKEQLLSMRKIVEDILYLNHCADNLQIEPVSLNEIVEETLSSYQIQAADKGLKIMVEGNGYVRTDREIMKKMIDNLLSNGVQYTPEGEQIQIILEDNKFCIKNYGAAIDPKLLPNIYEPFVSSDTGKKGKGLGLYVVSYYSRLLGGRVQIENFDNGVQAELVF